MALSGSSESQQLQEPQEGELVDVRELRRLGQLLFGALRRHRGRVFVILGLFALMTVGLVVLLPRTYQTQCRILAQRNLVMPALGNPKRAVPIDSDTPTRAVSESILSHDNVVAIVKQLNLLDQWENSRAPLLRLKDYLSERLHGPVDEKRRLEALTAYVGQQLAVTSDEETVTIAVDWPDPSVAFQLVDAAQQNFLAERHQTEVSTIAETIAILEGHAASIRETIETTIGEIEKARSAAHPKDADAPLTMRMVRHRPAGHDARISEIKEELDAKRRAISAMEQARDQEVTQVRHDLAQQKEIYAPAHPSLIATEDRLKALEGEPPQLLALKKQEQELASEYSSQIENVAIGTSMTRTPDVMTHRSGSKDDDSDDVVDYPKMRLKTASDDYEDLLRRIEGARIELETTQAAFKYRYRVIQPPEVPKKPVKPKIPVVIAACILLGLITSVFAALLADMRDGILHETWQVEQRLKIQVLAEIKGS